MAAPVGTDRLKAPVLLGPGGNPVVKLFIFAPAECYDFVSQVCLPAAYHPSPCKPLLLCYMILTEE